MAVNTCVVSLVDRLIHHSELIVLEGESYRMKEAKERAEAKKKAKVSRKKQPKNPKYQGPNKGK